MARPRTTGSRSSLGEEIEGMLADFCEAHHGANPKEVTRRALRQFIFGDLEGSPDVKARYEEARKARLKLTPPKVVSIKDGDT